MILGSSSKLWVRSFLLGIGTCVFAIGYSYVRNNFVNIYTLASSLTFAALLLINLSFALSGLSYFWHIGAGKLGYRKALGVVGFLFGIGHALLSLILYSDRFQTFDFFVANPIGFIPAWITIGIFSMMVVVSNFGFPAKLGALLWRKLLRVGYIGLLLIVVHAGVMSYGTWLYWLKTGTPILPPLSFITILLTVATLLLRVCLWWALKHVELSHVREKPHDI